eukprot:8538206-Lingulodinium_polyedra.AAC.1
MCVAMHLSLLVVWAPLVCKRPGNKRLRAKYHGHRRLRGDCAAERCRIAARQPSTSELDSGLSGMRRAMPR